MNKKQACILTILCITILFLGANAQAEIISGEIEVGPQKIITYKMENPEIPKEIFQYKVAPMELHAKQVRQIIKGYAQPKSKGDKWAFYNGSSVEDAYFQYNEDEGRYALNNMPYYGPRKTEQGEQSKRVTERAKKLLDELGITGYEDPFYASFPQFKYDETSLAAINTWDDYFRSIGGDSAKRYLFELFLDRVGTYVVEARFLLDGIPLCTADTRAEKRKTELDYEIGSGCSFVFNENLELVRAQVLNYVEVKKKLVDDQPILGWQECLQTAGHRLSIYEEEHTNMNLIEAELNYAIKDNGVTYPVWRFVFELDRRSEEEKKDPTYNSYSFGDSCVDAHTGRPCF